MNHLLVTFALFALAFHCQAKTLDFELQGEPAQGSLIFGKLAEPEPDIEVHFNDRALKVSEAGTFVFGIGRDDTGTFKVSARNGANTLQREYTIVERSFDIQRIEGVQNKHVNPPEEVLARIARENTAVAAARRANDNRTDFDVQFIWPLTGPITGVYGSQRFYNGVPRSPHYGLDIAAPTGTLVVAPAAGQVTFAAPDLYYSGGTLIVDHGHGVSSTFIHLHKLLVEIGQRVEQGQAVAEVGATGRATGPHLDWRMNWFGVRVDPQLLMATQKVPMPKPADAALD